MTVTCHTGLTAHLTADAARMAAEPGERARRCSWCGWWHLSRHPSLKEGQ